MEMIHKQSNNSTPKLSVYTTVYNGEKYLAEAIESILHQTFIDFEYIIVDDGSTDSTPEILAKYINIDKRIKVTTNEINLGLPKTRNIGLKNTRGQYVAIQDADDISLPERFAKQVGYLDNHPEIILVSTRVDRIDENGHSLGEGTVIRPKNWEETKRQLKRTNIIVQGSTMFRRDPIMKIGGYREKFQFSEEYDLWLRLCEIGRIEILPEYLYKWRFTGGSTSLKKNKQFHYFHKCAQTFQKERERSGTDSYATWEPTPPKSQTSSESSLTAYDFQKTYYLIISGKKTLARDNAKKMIKTDPKSILPYLFYLISYLPPRLVSEVRMLIWY